MRGERVGKGSHHSLPLSSTRTEHMTWAQISSHSTSTESDEIRQGYSQFMALYADANLLGSSIGRNG